ncbi:MAG: hypothetical protein IJV81_08785 [Paludibacteraceae bacterium]|nr:hypothetical protein [Paludibacteraceae bacterium]
MQTIRLPVPFNNSDILQPLPSHSIVTPLGELSDNLIVIFSVYILLIECKSTEEGEVKVTAYAIEDFGTSTIDGSAVICPFFSIVST